MKAKSTVIEAIRSSTMGGLNCFLLIGAFVACSSADGAEKKFAISGPQGGAVTVSASVTAKAAGATNNAVETELEKSLNELEANLDEAIARYTKLAATDDERVRQFDVILGRIERVVDFTAIDGPLQKKVEIVLGLQKQKVRNYSDKSKDETFTEDHRIKYAEFASRDEKAVSATFETLKKLQRIREELRLTLDVVKEEKVFYADVLQAKELEEARLSLERVGEAMRRVQAIISGGLSTIIKDVTKQAGPPQT